MLRSLIAVARRRRVGWPVLCQRNETPRKDTKSSAAQARDRHIRRRARSRSDVERRSLFARWRNFRTKINASARTQTTRTSRAFVLPPRRP